MSRVKLDRRSNKSGWAAFNPLLPFSPAFGAWIDVWCGSHAYESIPHVSWLPDDAAALLVLRGLVLGARGAEQLRCNSSACKGSASAIRILGPGCGPQQGPRLSALAQIAWRAQAPAP